MRTIIQNFKQLATNHDKKLALSIIERGLESSLPYVALQKTVKQNYLQLGKKRLFFKKHDNVYVVAIGKSADLMTKAVASLTHVKGGIVVMPSRMHRMIDASKFVIVRSSHPLPSGKSVIAAKKVINFLKSLDSTDFVMFLVSGGASSLLSLPDGISLNDKQITTDLLLKSGADIHEINCVRKHLSKIKGGQLLESLRCNAVSLVMSDVIGDDLSVIASGLTYCDKSTFPDAKKTLLKYNLKDRVPKSVWNRIVLGTMGKVPETPKKPKIENYVISSNKDCIDAMKAHAEKLGVATKTIWPVNGHVKNAAAKISKIFPLRKNSCLIFGGETTVTVKGKGMGGRNQELVLYLLQKMQARNEKMIAISVGTDGVDGNTIAAGAIVDHTMPKEQINKYLKNNNSYCYFKKYGGAIFTGPTHTNLMDIGLVLHK